MPFSLKQMFFQKNLKQEQIGHLFCQIRLGLDFRTQVNYKFMFTDFLSKNGIKVKPSNVCIILLNTKHSFFQ